MKFEKELSVHFPASCPVVGFEFVPVVAAGAGSNTPVPDHLLTFEWYRSEEAVKGICSVHPHKTAEFQCACCVKLDLPVQFSYHCSNECFYQSWHLHKERHDKAAKNAGSVNVESESKDDLKTFDPYWFSHINQQTSSINRILLDAMQKDENEQPWQKVSSSKIYTPEIVDIGHRLRLKCTPVNSGALSSSSLFVYTPPVLPSFEPPSRRMVQINPARVAANVSMMQVNSSDEIFSILSYNILSEIYATTDVHGHCPSWALAWEYRRQNLLREILTYKADIICLQEVESDHFANFYAPQLAKHGYSALYKRKTNPIYTRGQYVMDGCATFFLSDRFMEVENFEIEFVEAPQKFFEIFGRRYDHSSCRSLMKDNIALSVVLKLTKSDPASNSSKSQNSPSICVVNTHVHANHQNSNVKLLQVYFLLHELERRVSSERIPILICADLNSQPRSAVYDLVVTGSIDSNHPDLKDDPTGIFQNLALSHTFPLVSAYSTLLWTKGDGPGLEDLKNRMDSTTGEPKFTNVSCNFMGTIDYIFFTGDAFTLNGLLEYPCGEINRKRPLPSPQWSSDHIALMASFRIHNKTWGRTESPVRFSWPQAGGIELTLGEVQVRLGGQENKIDELGFG